MLGDLGQIVDVVPDHRRRLVWIVGDGEKTKVQLVVHVLKVADDGHEEEHGEKNHVVDVVLRPRDEFCGSSRHRGGKKRVEEGGV